MAKSVKVNYILNLINTGTQVLLPLITFPYASRILGVEGIGHVNFFASIISYILLFTSLGIPMYAIKEIASKRDNEKEMNISTIEILSLHLGLNVLGYIAVGVICLFVPQIKADVPLFLLLSLTIIFTTVGCEWFYQGVEDFAYITIRGIIVKVLSILFLFLFVRERQDIMPYAFFTVFGVLGGNIFNFFRLRKYINWNNVVIRNLHPLRHLKGALVIFAYSLVTSIYMQLNTLFLGFMKGDEAVGYYTAALKLNTAIVSLITALSAVMIPRLSNLIATKQDDEFKKMAQKSYDFLFFISLPISIGMIFLSPYIIPIFTGNEFVHSIGVSRIISFTLFFIAISSVMGIQILFPLGKIKDIIKSGLIGCSVDLIFCIILIPLCSYNGAGAAYLLAEISVSISMIIISKKSLPLTFIRKNHWIYIFGATIMALSLWIADGMNMNIIMKSVIMIFIGAGMYFFVMIVFKEPLFMENIRSIAKKIHR